MHTMVRTFKLTSNIHPSGQLVVLESGSEVSLNIQRVFVVKGKQGAVRGKHAHRRLTQILVCLHGICKITFLDGQNKGEITLDQPDVALEIPPGIWAEQHYVEPDTILMVLCDQPYDESDYIRDFAEFIEFRKEKQA